MKSWFIRGALALAIAPARLSAQQAYPSSPYGAYGNPYSQPAPQSGYGQPQYQQPESAQPQYQHADTHDQKRGERPDVHQHQVVRTRCDR